MTKESVSPAAPEAPPAPQDAAASQHPAPPDGPAVKKKSRWRFSLRRLSPYLTAVLGAFILAFGLYNVHSRCDVTEGGVLGMTLLLHHWFGVSPGISGFILDVSCYLVGFRFLGKSFLRFSIVSSCAFSLSYSLLERFPPLLPDLSAMPLAAAIVGGLFVGIGVGIVVRQGGACGGDDALAMTISKVSGLQISRAYLFTDLVVLGLSLSYIAPLRIFYSLITVTISSFLIGRIQNLTLPIRSSKRLGD